MRKALALAAEAFRVGEVPVGALVVREGQVIAQAFNLREALADPTAHAECLALSLAGRALGTWRLTGCSLVATLEPCPMCTGAALQARVERIIFGASDPKAGTCGSLYRLAEDPRFSHQIAVTGGILAEDCGRLLSEFFQGRRPRSSKPPEGCLSG